MKQKRGSIQSYGSISNVEGYEQVPDGSDYEEDEDINGNCKLIIHRLLLLFFIFMAHPEVNSSPTDSEFLPIRPLLDENL